MIDTQSKTRIGDIPTGNGPVRIRVTRDGKMLVYALQTGEAVGLPLRTRKIERIISAPPGSGPDPYLPLR